MINLTVIIPMHEFGKDNIELLNKAVESVPSDYKVILSTKKGVTKKSLNGISDRLEVVSLSEGDSFAELVNAAVEAIDTKWFSILEFDDTYTAIWETNVNKYIEYKPEISLFMTFEDITDFNNDRYIGVGNEAAWASAFSNEIGYIDNECLQNYFDFYLTGSVFNTDDWKEIGGLKPSIKITFWYEWLLRATNQGKKVYVIPKVCYNHHLARKGSLVETYKETMSQEEIQGWFDIAKREYLYKMDRNKVYEPNKSDEEIANEEA